MNENMAKRYKYDNSDRPYIEDINVFKAVNFARAIVKKGKDSMGLAIYKAAKYYKVPETDVAKQMGKFASYVKEKYKGYDNE